jgi:hypothetical protein
MTNRQVVVLVVVLAGLLLVLPCVLVVGGGAAGWLWLRPSGPPPAAGQGEPEPAPAEGQNEPQDGPEPGKPRPEKVEWGKEVGGLAVSISPAAQDKGRILVRWKNVGKEPLELPWVRFGSDPVYKDRDDLLNHVSLKKPGGDLVPARKYEFPKIGGPPYRPRTVILDPEKVHEETIDLWTYVEKPAEEGRYQVWVELEVRTGYAPSREGARYWTGKIQSNVLEVELAK